MAVQRHAFNPSTAGRPTWHGWIFALGATFCFSLSPAVARGAIVDGMDPTALLLARTFLATLMFALLLGASARQDLALPRKYLLPMFIAGSANGVAMLFLFQGLARIDASIASMMLALLPLLVLGMLSLRGESITRRHIVRLTLALSGVYLLIGPGGTVDKVGILVLASAMLLFAFTCDRAMVFAGSQSTHDRSLYVNLYVERDLDLVDGTDRALAHAGQQDWIAILILGVVSTFFARIFFYEGIQRVGGAQVVLLVPLELLLNLLWAALFLNERMTSVQWIGASLILGSTLLAFKRLRIRRKPRRVRVPV